MAFVGWGGAVVEQKEGGKRGEEFLKKKPAHTHTHTHTHTQAVVFVFLILSRVFISV